MNRVEQFLMSGMSGMTITSSNTGGILFDNLFDKFISVDIDGDFFEIPSFLYAHANIAKTRGYNRLSFPLVNRDSGTQRRLIKGILSDFMTSASNQCTVKVRVTDGSVYYGLPGIIFDADFNTLLSVNEKIAFKENKELPAASIFKVVRVVCRISPLVFSNSNKIIEKNIIKKMMPMCTEIIPNNFRLNQGMRDNIGFNKKIQVIIDDINLVRRPQNPRQGIDFTNTVLNHLKEIWV